MEQVELVTNAAYSFPSPMAITLFHCYSVLLLKVMCGLLHTALSFPLYLLKLDEFCFQALCFLLIFSGCSKYFFSGSPCIIQLSLVVLHLSLVRKE